MSAYITFRPVEIHQEEDCLPVMLFRACPKDEIMPDVRYITPKEQKVVPKWQLAKNATRYWETNSFERYEWTYEPYHPDVLTFVVVTATHPFVSDYRIHPITGKKMVYSFYAWASDVEKRIDKRLCRKFIETEKTDWFYQITEFNVMRTRM